MQAFAFSSSAVGIGLAAALLSACGGGSPSVATGNTFTGSSRLRHHEAFAYTGAQQTFTVPAGVSRLTVVARGGAGGGGGAFYRYGRSAPCDPSSEGGGGGGGSSYVEPGAIKSRMWTGWKAKGDGLVVFRWQ